jgi:hypothetical protein
LRSIIQATLTQGDRYKPILFTVPLCYAAYYCTNTPSTHALVLSGKDVGLPTITYVELFESGSPADVATLAEELKV